MKHSRLMLIALASVLLTTACAKEEAKGTDPEQGEVHLYVNATAPDAVKTEIHGESDVYWSSRDIIRVLYGKYYLGTFHSMNDQPSVTTTFESDATFIWGWFGDGQTKSFPQEKYIAVAGSDVYQLSKGTDEKPIPTLSVILNSDQYAVAGTFDPMGFPAAGISDDLNIKFYNLCGGVKFKLSQSGITSVVFRALGGETIAGEFLLDPNIPSRDIPFNIAPGDNYCSSEIVLSCPDGFKPDTYYYISLLPGTLSKGFEMSFRDDILGHQGRRSSAIARIVNRSSFADLGVADTDVKLDEKFASPLMSELYRMTSEPLHLAFLSSRPDNFGFAAMDYSNDMECADLITPDSGYNWFSTCMALSSRNADYANPYIRYNTPYSVISACNDAIKVLSAYPDSEPDARVFLAQARAMRAYSYMRLAPYFQFSPLDANGKLDATKYDAPCIPIVDENTADLTNNPRASIREVYELILKDLDFAVANLEGFTRSDKSKIDRNVAYGLRARANLEIGEYQKALDDAKAAAQGYAPARITGPSFMDINESNWIWGYDMTQETAGWYLFATSSSWIRSFSSVGYSTACQCYACVNKLLYDKIPVSDVRKGWWVDENLSSPLLNGLDPWPGLDPYGRPFTDIANADDDGSTKMVFLPYTNVKFGCFSVGTKTNDEDWPYMRVEEMLLIQAEALVRLGNEGEAEAVLGDFVKNYRDPDWTWEGNAGVTAIDKVWFQRRVELWGEGFANSDCRRFNKPLVRFHGSNEADSNVPYYFRFNLASDSPVWLLRFPSDALKSNPALTDNPAGPQPQPGQNPDLKDGVTD